MLVGLAFNFDVVEYVLHDVRARRDKLLHLQQDCCSQDSVGTNRMLTKLLSA